MTMPEFKPIGFWNGKESAFFEHEYEGEFPPPGHSIPIHTSNQLNQAYSAGQAELIAAREEIEKLKDCFAIEGGKVDVLEQLLTQSREEIKTLQTNLRMSKWERAELELLEQLAVSQADNERLREALTWARSGFNQASNGFQSQKHLEDHWILCNEALSTKPDNSALHEHDAKLVERIAGEAPTPAIFEWIGKFADKIREGKF